MRPDPEFIVKDLTYIGIRKSSRIIILFLFTLLIPVSVFSAAADETVPADYTGDGTREVGIFRPSSGLWAIRGLTRNYYGSASDQPVPADYDGDSSDNIGIFRESSGLWAIRDLSRVYFGRSGDLPVSR
jgi:hypothetical protein